MSPNAAEEMRSYLLGTLDPARKKELEDRIVHAPEASEELLMLEEELIDQYLAGELSDFETKQFETYFLTTPERRKNLRFGQLLKSYNRTSPTQEAVTATRDAEISSAPKPFMFSHSLLSGRPLMTFFLAGIALFGIVLVFCLAFRRAPALVAQHDAEQMMIVTLAPGPIVSGDGITKQVTVPPKGYNVKLELELKSANFQNYRFELFRENKSVQTSGAPPIEAKGQQYVIPLTITGEVLSPGDYQVKLSGVSDSGANEFIENYSFRVIE